MFDYQGYIENCITKLHEEKRYRVFREIGRRRGQFPIADFHLEGQVREVTVWCSNDYLGMGQNPTVLSSIHDSLEAFGAGAGGTRNISGTHRLIVSLENELADLHNKEASLVFSSGYVANEAALSTLGSMLPDAVILSDSDNHASMIEGMKRCKAKKLVFRHNDPEHLEELLKEIPVEKPKIVAFEALYSMSGARAPLKKLIDISKRYGALIYVDETHSVALYGARGGGLLEEAGLLKEVDVIQGGLGKGFGIVGGFITGSKAIIDLVRSYGSGFIFTTSMPPMVAAGALASIRYLKNNHIERQSLFAKAETIKNKMLALGLPILETDTQIIPFMVRDSQLCQEIADTLLYDYGIYIQPINYPTVARGEERLRITPSPLHTEEMIDHLVNSLSEVWNEKTKERSNVNCEEQQLRL
ncbi:MAG: 5-aminolevulinate synthase [bacterium]|mgnify:CR=1 FL=1|nr:5-aminolevulinate synthase [bacterium]